MKKMLFIAAMLLVPMAMHAGKDKDNKANDNKWPQEQQRVRHMYVQCKCGHINTEVYIPNKFFIRTCENCSADVAFDTLRKHPINV